jgi:uncharacterized protein involved in exopolysaccharide biosynthesis
MIHDGDVDGRLVPPSDDEEISLLGAANTLLRNWRVVVGLPLVLALVVGMWAVSQERMYAATASFVPEAAESRSGGAAALAQQFGVSLGGEQRGRSPQFYADLLRSPAILRPLVETEYRLPGQNGAIEQGTLIELLEISTASARRPSWRLAADEVLKKMSASVTRETGVIHVQVQSHHPGLAEQVAERLLGLLHEFNTEARQHRAQEEGRFIAERMADAQAEVLASEGALQDFLRHNREFRNSPELVFEHDRLQRQVAMRQEVFTSLLRAGEEARIDGVRDTPLLTVIDHPAGSALPQGRGTVRLSLLAFLLGLMVAVFVAFVRDSNRRSREAGDPHYREFEGLARQTWDELRRPARWLRRKEKPVAAGDR